MLPKEIGPLGVIEWPASTTSTPKVPCVICKDTISMQDVTAGAQYADGRQAFACTDHAWNKSSWLVSWIKFAQEELSTK